MSLAICAEIDPAWTANPPANCPLPTVRSVDEEEEDEDLGELEPTPAVDPLEAPDDFDEDDFDDDFDDDFEEEFDDEELEERVTDDDLNADDEDPDDVEFDED
jgi:hypothetical protein